MSTPAGKGEEPLSTTDGGTSIVDLPKFCGEQTGIVDAATELGIAETHAAYPSPIPGRSEDAAPPEEDIDIAASTAMLDQQSAEFFTLREELHSLNSPCQPAPNKTFIYLLVDIDTIESQLRDPSVIKNTAKLKKLLAEVRPLVGHEAPGEYHVSITPSNQIQILCTAERGAKPPLTIAESIERHFPEARMFVGRGETKEEAGNIQILGDFPQDADLPTTIISDRYISRTLAELIKNPNSREGSTCQIETEEIPGGNPNFLLLKKVIPKLSKLYAGGPDRLIGYKTEFDEICDFTENEDQKLLFLKGEAGIGKSRILSTALESLTENTSSIVCSLDAADKNISGASLVTFAEQLSTIIEEDPLFKTAGEGGEVELNGATPLQAFNKGNTRAEKLKIAQESPEELVDMCLHALDTISFTKLSPKTLLVVEDLHHSDIFSERFITKIISQFLEKTDFGERKAICSMRPEEMFESQAQAQLEDRTQKYFGKASTKSTTLKGLDFSGTEDSPSKLAYDFIYYSLPKELLAAHHGNLRLGSWFQILGNAAQRSPLAMKTFMDEILDSLREGKVRVMDGVLQCFDQELLQRISTYKINSDSDLAKVFSERISKLKETPKQLLQCFAIAGGKLTKSQICSLYNLITPQAGEEEGTTDRTMAAVTALADQLVLRGFLNKSGKNAYELSNPAFKDFVISSIESPDEKFMLANFLHRAIKTEASGQEETPESIEAEFSILHTITSGPDSLARYHKLWTHYQKAAAGTMAHAASLRQREKAFSTAKTILEGFFTTTPETATPEATTPETTTPETTTPKQQKTLLVRTIQALEKGEPLPTDQNPAIQTLAIQALFTIAENGAYTGKFKNAEAALSTLEKIHEKNPSLELDIDKIILLGFYIAYAQSDTDQTKIPKMEACVAKIKNSTNTPSIRKIVDRIRLMLRTGKYQTVLEGFTKGKAEMERLNQQHETEHNGSPNPDYMEILRLVCRGKMNDARKQIKRVEITDHKKGGKIIATRRLDDDILYDPDVIDQSLRPAFSEVRKEAELLIEKLQQYPHMFEGSPFSETATIEMAAQARAFEGNYENGELFKEAHRQAMHMGSYSEAARYGKLEGDLIMIQAIKASQRGETAKAIELTKKAIQTYREKSKAAAEETLDNQNQYYMVSRIQIIRAVSIMFELQKKMGNIQPAAQAELLEYREAALNDFREISAAKKDTMKEEEIGEVSYCLMGSMGNIVDSSAELGLGFPDESIFDGSHYPLMTRDAITKGLVFGGNMTDKGAGVINGKTETDRKMRGLYVMEDLTRRKETEKLRAIAYRQAHTSASAKTAIRPQIIGVPETPPQA